MKIDQILEMTMKSGPLSSQAEDVLKRTLDYIDSIGVHDGYVERKAVVKVVQNDALTLGIKNDDSVTAFVNGTIDGNVYTLNVMYTAPKYRNLGDIARLLYFIKHHLEMQILGYGVQSPDGIKFFDALHASNRFKMYWLNVQTGEKVPYENADDRRNTVEKTAWRVLLEADTSGSSNKLERWDDNIMKMWYTIIDDPAFNT